MIKEQVAVICARQNRLDYYKIAAQGYYLETAYQIHNLYMSWLKAEVGRLTVIGDEEILELLRELTEDEWIRAIKVLPEYNRVAQLQHTKKQLLDLMGGRQ